MSRLASYVWARMSSKLTYFGAAPIAQIGSQKTGCRFGGMKTLIEIRNLSSEELLESLLHVSRSERAFSIQVLWHLVAVDNRGLALKAGYDSLFSYCVKVLKYDPGSAHRRVKAAKLWREHPEVEKDLESGELTLSSAAVLQTHFDHRTKHRRPISKSAQKTLIQDARGKSRRTLEAELIGELPDDVPKPETRIKAVAKNLNRLELFVDDAFLEDLEKLRALRIYAEPSGEATKLIHAAILKELEREQKRRFGAASVERMATDASLARSQTPCSPENPNRVKPEQSVFVGLKRTPIRAAVRAAVHQRADGKCQFRDVQTNRACDSHFALEIDHVIPIELGGGHTVDNLQLLCSSHHRYRHCQEQHRKNSARSAAHSSYYGRRSDPSGGLPDE